MINTTLNKIYFNFHIQIPVNESFSDDNEYAITEKSHESSDHFHLTDTYRPVLEDFHVGDLVRYRDNYLRECEIMKVIGYLKPYYIQVIAADEDPTCDYKIYDIYPEDIEVIGCKNVYRKSLLNCYHF